MATLRERFIKGAIAPYVYNYPPTRLYRPLAVPAIDDLAVTRRLNLYIHIPFCEQKCTFCGYLTVIDTSADLRSRYVEALCQELRAYAPLLARCEIASINFGGGTPSLLGGDELGKILATVKEAKGSAPAPANEVSIEATPETVTRDKFSAYRAHGINRVSIGIQTLNDSEIRSVKRHNRAPISLSALAMLRAIGFPNVCVDLMYGLPGQDSASFAASVDAVIAERPETVELYGTVVIPGTALAKTITPFSELEKIRSYETARDRFLAAGYAQECHLRFALPGRGGYCQQENVYALETLIGVGVGARSYTERLHYRNVHDTAHSRDALRRYLDLTARGILPVERGVSMTDDELMHRYAVHRLERFDEADFYRRFGISARETFPIIKRFLEEEILRDSGGVLILDPSLLAHRDRIAREFFSPAALSGEETYYADGLVELRRTR